MAVFRRLLDDPAFHTVDAGIVLQAYLPDSYEALQELVAWATERRNTVIDGKQGGQIKIRLVKGANLAMEKVDAVMHGWEQAPYRSKHESDANYKRCLDWVLNSANTEAVRVGVASHNLFDVAFAWLLAEQRGVTDRIEFEMLEGMAAGLARTIRDESGGLLLYTPVVERDDFDVAISYLFRRLEENASDGNFIRHLFDLASNPSAFAREEDRFRTALAARNTVGYGPQRSQDRMGEARGGGSVRPSDGLAAAQSPTEFVNEPDSDPSLPSTRAWARSVMERAADPGVAQTKADIERSTVVIDDLYARARSAGARWAAEPAATRQRLLHAAADQLVQRRGDLIAAMVVEANKTFEQADVEVSEAIDFARWYGDRALELTSPVATFQPHGVVAVIPPWNFPVAIPAGGVLAALAAGNAVVFKPAPQVPRCSELVTECLHDAGIDPDLVNYVRTEDNEVGQHLVSHPDCDAVILTGAYETAELFRSWKPDLRILAETSGKNSMIITANADVDEAVSDLVYSAFGHGGQKCSAASLAILVGPVAQSERFRNQLIDAVTSLVPGPAHDLASDLSPLIEEPTGKLAKALTTLEPGESWLIEPRRISDGLWTPGVRLGVKPDSWFHQTECFGPVLGIMEAPDLETAIALQNGVAYGLTGGIHTLDPDEIEQWLDAVEIGNAYVNRATTGAIVRRQPFGGWKRSSIGPGAKAGGVNYLRQLGQWLPTEASETAKAADAQQWLADAAVSDRQAWAAEFGTPEDHAGLFCEANIFRYRPVPAIGLIGADVDPTAAQRCRNAAAVAGVPVIEHGSPLEVVRQTAAAGGPRVRVVGVDELDPALLADLRSEAQARELHLADDPVTADGRQELLHYLREQSVSRTLHRHGNVLNGEQLP
jgi:RHH-type proline utilization regulon transcriptional repressor/proline dehydrogenase/delta 1-pyrroline-5-carboxylate dehydrogenase